MKEKTKTFDAAAINFGMFGYVLRQNDRLNEIYRENQLKEKDSQKPLVDEKEERQLPFKNESKSLSKENQFSYKFLISSLAGLSAGSFAAVMMFPTEAMKKRKQSGQPPIGFKANEISTWLPSGKKLYTGGLGYVACVGPTTLIQNDALSVLLSTPGMSNYAISAAISCGALGGIFSVVAENTILTQQYQREGGNPCGPFAAFKMLYKYGPLKPWTGLSPIMVREGIFGGLALSLADKFSLWCKHQFEWKYSDRLGLIGIAVLGALITHPFDSIATAMQVNLSKGVFEFIPQVIKKIYKEKGIKEGFYKGGLYRVGLFTGCMLAISQTKPKFEEMASSILENEPKSLKPKV